MKKSLIGLGLIASLIAPVFAQERKVNDFQSNPISFPDDYHSNHSMGCLLLGECTAGVVEIKSIRDVEIYFNDRYTNRQEFNDLVSELNKAGSKVFIAPTEYFPVGHRGVYHTVTNNFYLNAQHIKRFGILISVLRHEGWHAAQDCMAGTIDNSMIALILPEEDVPEYWQELVRRTYPKEAWPWEKEATWAGKTEGMTLKALKACNTGAPWEIYNPTPMTKEWLQRNGYID